MILWGNWRKVCAIGIMKWGTQSTDGTAGREETHHQATPGCNIHVHLRSSEKFLPWRSQSQITSKITTNKLQSHVVLNSSFQPNTWGLPQKCSSPLGEWVFLPGIKINDDDETDLLFHLSSAPYNTITIFKLKMNRTLKIYFTSSQVFFSFNTTF